MDEEERVDLKEYRLYNRILPVAFLAGVLLFLLYFVTLAPPLSFPSATYIKVQKGTTIDQVGAELKAKHIIISARLFELFARVWGSRGEIVAGEYFFPGPENVIEVGKRLAQGDYDITPTRVTIPEGATSVEIGQELEQRLPDFNESDFDTAASAKEGYLFPDTYFFLPGEDTQEIISTLTTNFDNHSNATSTQAALAKSGRSLADIVIMASILEKEAPDTHNRQIIAGILWHRIQLGMPLQVDSSLTYALGVNSLDLTKQDLASDSPYNTYINKGLPPGPISNPGMDSIMAAMTPIKTSYLYFLSDLKGNFHYCQTYACQRSNAAYYLGH